MYRQIPDLAQEVLAPGKSGQRSWEVRQLKFLGVDHSFGVVSAHQLRDWDPEYVSQARQDLQRRVTTTPFEVRDIWKRQTSPLGHLGNCQV